MNTTKHQFEFKNAYVRGYDDDTTLYEVKFPIADDGCPHSEQWLRVRVFLEPSCSPLIELTMITQTGENVFKERLLGNVRTDNMSALACLLYGAAHLRTRQYLEPI